MKKKCPKNVKKCSNKPPKMSWMPEFMHHWESQRKCSNSKPFDPPQVLGSDICQWQKDKCPLCEKEAHWNRSHGNWVSTSLHKVLPPFTANMMKIILQNETWSTWDFMSQLCNCLECSHTVILFPQSKQQGISPLTALKTNPLWQNKNKILFLMRPPDQKWKRKSERNRTSQVHNKWRDK